MDVSFQISRRAKYIMATLVVGLYGYIALRGPQGIQSLLDKRQEIRALEEKNAVTAREVEQRKERIRRLQDSPSEQEMEIRRQLKLLKPGETTFILPDAPPDSSAEPKPTNPN